MNGRAEKKKGEMRVEIEGTGRAFMRGGALDAESRGVLLKWPFTGRRRESVRGMAEPARQLGGLRALKPANSTLGPLMLRRLILNHS